MYPQAHVPAAALRRWLLLAPLLALLGLAACNRAADAPGGTPAAAARQGAADGRSATVPPSAASAPTESIYSVVPPKARL